MLMIGDGSGINEEVGKILEVLNPVQVRYVVAYVIERDKRKALEAVGLRGVDYGRWSERDKALVEEACRLIDLDVLGAALALRRKALLEALMVKVAGLRSRSEAVRQRVATEIIEWELGKAVARHDVSLRREGAPYVRLLQEIREAIDGEVVTSDTDWGEVSDMEEGRLLSDGSAEGDSRGSGEVQVNSGGREGWEE